MTLATSAAHSSGAAITVRVIQWAESAGFSAPSISTAASQPVCTLTARSVRAIILNRPRTLVPALTGLRKRILSKP